MFSAKFIIYMLVVVLMSVLWNTVVHLLIQILWCMNWINMLNVRTLWTSIILA